jgi:hypothetical protein
MSGSLSRKQPPDIEGTDEQWRLVAKISGGAAPENCIFFINWGMATDIKLKDYIQV